MTIMLSFGDFLNSYCLYPSQTLAVYQIWKDLEGKQEINDVCLQDGRYNGFPGYLIYGEANFTKLKRVMIPISADSELDLEWYTYVRLIHSCFHLLKVVFTVSNRLRQFLVICHASSTEVFICIHTPETIM